MTNKIYYHVFNRGAHKRDVFIDSSDYERMQKLLYVANSAESFVFRNLPFNVYSLARKKPLVRIVSYCLMPDHIHIAIEQIKNSSPHERDCVTRFLHRLMTAYTGYFNRKYGHSGTIWQGSYREKTRYDEHYIDKLVTYIHENPRTITRNIDTYEYSSLMDHRGALRPESAIIA